MAREWLEKMISGVAGLSIGAEAISFTISAGATMFSGKKMDVDALVREADDQLYKSKEGGRNCFHLTAFEDTE